MKLRSVPSPTQIEQPRWLIAVFQITFKVRVPTRGLEGSIDVGLPTSSQVSHLFCQVRWLAFLGF